MRVDSLLLTVVGVGLLVLGGGLAVALYALRRRPDEDGKYPEGHWLGLGMGIGIALGMPVGLAIGLITDNFALGPALGGGLGVGLGCAFGGFLQRKYRHLERPLTPGEKRLRKYTVAAGVLLAVVGVAVFSTIFFLRV